MAIANITNNILTDSGVATSSLLPLTGGTLTGALNINLSSGTAMNVAGNAIFRGDTGVGTPRQLIITSGGSTPVYLEAKGYGANYQTDFGIRTFNSVGTSFEVFYATSSGLVGINQTSPAYLLDVNGTFGATSAFLSSYIRTDGSAGFKNTSSGGTAPSSLASYSQLFFDSYSLMVRKADGQINTFRYPNVASTQTWDFNVEGYLTAQSTASLTTGSVMFANSVGKITQDNAQFFWDDTNNRLGIGTSGPSQKLEVAGADVKILINSSDYAALQLKAGSVRTFNIVAKNDGTGLLSIYDATAAADRLTIASTGAATFSSSVTAQSLDIISASGVGSSTASGLARFITAGTSTAISVGQSNQTRRLDIGTYYINVTGEQFELSTASAQPLIFNTNATERMRITSGGNVLIGTTTATSQKLTVNSATAAGQVRITGAAPTVYFTDTVTDPANYVGLVGLATATNNFFTGTAAGDFVMYNQVNGYKLFVVNYSGGVYLTSGATSWTANSDIRLKNINSHIENAVEKLSTLQTINFSYKDDKFKKQNLGLIAQEVEKIFPELIDKNNDGMLGVRYTELVPVLVKAIQEQQLQIEELKLKIK
jgi:hypothetical protein